MESRFDVGLEDKALSLDTLLAGFSNASGGAVVAFSGNVRGEEEGRPISAIRYEAYVGMARKELEKAAREAAERFGARVRIRHRLGSVPTGEASLIVLCAAPHREEAFQAARFAVEKIKKDVPIWKTEFETNGDGRRKGAGGGI